MLSNQLWHFNKKKKSIMSLKYQLEKRKEIAHVPFHFITAQTVAS